MRLLFLFLLIATTATAQKTYTLTNALHGFDKAEFVEHPTWFDGTPLSEMPDSIFDNILFVKRKTSPLSGWTYYKRKVSDHYKPEWFGFLPKHLKARQNKIKNVDAWHNFQKSFPVGSTARVYIPAGEYEVEG